MKLKQIITMLIGFMLAFSVVYAQGSPLPINGRVIGEDISNLPVQITNTRSSESIIYYTTGSGEYLVGVSEFKNTIPRILGGDVFRVIILSCASNPKCTQEITYTGQDELFLLFDLTDEDTGGEPEPVCGNGIIESSEQCDDNNNVNGDGCSSTCIIEEPEEVCGDGIIQSPEECDDGNTVNGDGCNSVCVTEVEPEPEPEVEIENKVRPQDGNEIAVSTAYFGQTIDIRLDDSKLSYLIDGTTNFNGDTYDIKEEIYSNLVCLTSIDDKDFGLKPYCLIEEYAIEYRFIFDDYINLNEITEDDPLNVRIAGRDLKIIKASADEITVRYGRKLTLLQGRSDTTDGDTIKVTAVMENQVSVEVNKVIESIYLGDNKVINGIDVLVDNILYQGYSGGVKQATLIIGDKVQDTYRN